MQYYVIDASNAPTLPKFTKLLEKVFNLPHPQHDLNSAPEENVEINDLTAMLEEIIRGVETRDIREASLTIIDCDKLLKDSSDYSGKEFVEFLDGVVSEYGQEKFKYRTLTTQELAEEISNKVVKKNKDSVQNIAHYQLGIPFDNIAPSTKMEIQKQVEENCRKRKIKLDYSAHDDMPIIQPRWSLMFTAKGTLF